MKNKNDIEDLIIKYFSNELSSEEQNELLNLIESNSEYKDEFHKYKSTSDAILASLREFTFDHEKAYNKFEKTIQNTPARKRNKIISLSRWAAIAAAIISIVWLFTHRGNQIEIQTVTAETQNVKLFDGSEITLNGNSQIIYPEKFKKNIKQRCVKFSGEGYFNIKSNPNLPFIADMDKIQIEVKGTSFNVLQDSTLGFIKVNVCSGTVLVYNKTNNTNILLNKGERAEFDYKTNLLNKYEFNELNYLSWKTGILVFRNTPLYKVIEDLNKYYNVSIEFENEEIKNCKLDTKIDNIKFAEVIQMLEMIFEIKIKKIDNTYYIAGKGC